MTLDDLRKALASFARLPGSTPVILQKDAEGNGYSPLAGGEEAMYLPLSDWSGEVHLTPEGLAEKLAESNSLYDEEDDAPPEEAVRAIVLYPVN